MKTTKKPKAKTKPTKEKKTKVVKPAKPAKAKKAPTKKPVKGAKPVKKDIKATKGTKVAKTKKSPKNADAKISSSISATTKAQVNLVEHPVLKIKPITNLSSEEQHQVIDNLNDLAQAQTTFADKYYVLDNGLVVMIATTKKDVKGIKKYLRR